MVDTVRGRLGVFIYSRHRRFVSQLILDKQGANFSSRDGAPGSDELAFSLLHTDHIYEPCRFINIYLNMFLIKVSLLISLLLVTSTLSVPHPFASPSKVSLLKRVPVLFQFLIVNFLQNCNLVRSQSNTGQCFSEPECEQKCNTRYEMVYNY